MPCYELLLVMAPRANKRDILSTLRKVGAEIVDRGGVMREFKSIGLRHTPHLMRRHGKCVSEGRYLTVKVDCSSDARRCVDQICKDEINVMRWFMPKVKAPKIQPLRRNEIEQLMEHSRPVISDPTFDIPKQAEMRRLQYNAKRKALDDSEQNLY